MGVAVTVSGREYTLVGEEAPISALRAFHTVWRLPRGREVHRVAPEDVAKALANAPLLRERTAAERAASQRLKTEIYARKIAGLARFAGLADTDVARMLGISVDAYEAMKSGSVPAGLSAEHAEQAFVYVAGRMNGHSMPEPGALPDEDEPDFDVEAREREVRHQSRRQRMQAAKQHIENRSSATRRHRLEQAAFALPYLHLSDPDMDADECATALGVTADELREILGEVPHDDEEYTVPAPRLRH
ncbi:hypothetical protein [Aliihoeflea sp. 40Bstr573]|uniref:hypothetical protein n=1 Tax=Aliihoeflea sp. 40Bstr573 TaxID=2696467 RepID=UPI0020957583|nr:hypothetical protein [Aliihoeflea sp. 40Bstr573]MCO6387480.1 hypothetical protein [Aliihoeflea sp. 40Bstr573]